MDNDQPSKAWPRLDGQSFCPTFGLFTEKGFSEEAKTLYGLSDEAFDVISRYRKGFFESVDLAYRFVEMSDESLRRTDNLKELVQFAQITSKYGDDEVKIAQLVDRKTFARFKEIRKSLKSTSLPAAKAVFTFLEDQSKSKAAGWLSGLLGKQAGKRGAKVLLGAVGVIFLARDAYAGGTGQGHHPELTGLAGAADNVAYNAMFGDVVEGAVGGTIEYGAQFATPPAPGVTRRGFQRGVEAFDPSIISGVSGTVPHKKDVPDTVPEKKCQSNLFWRMLGYD